VSVLRERVSGELFLEVLRGSGRRERQLVMPRVQQDPLLSVGVPGVECFRLCGTFCVGPAN